MLWMELQRKCNWNIVLAFHLCFPSFHRASSLSISTIWKWLCFVLFFLFSISPVCHICTPSEGRARGLGCVVIIKSENLLFHVVETNRISYYFKRFNFHGRRGDLLFVCLSSKTRFDIYVIRLLCAPKHVPGCFLMLLWMMTELFSLNFHILCLQPPFSDDS